MKLFRVTSHRDGARCKAPGISSVQLEEVIHYYAANSIEQVWEETAALRQLDDEELISVVDLCAGVTVLTEPEKGGDDGNI